MKIKMMNKMMMKIKKDNKSRQKNNKYNKKDKVLQYDNYIKLLIYVGSFLK